MFDLFVMAFASLTENYSMEDGDNHHVKRSYFDINRRLTIRKGLMKR